MPAISATIPLTTPTPLSGLALAILLLGGCGDKPTPTMSPPSASGASETRTIDMSIPLAVVTFTPFATTAGTPFNVQSDGNSGISFELNRPAPPADAEVWFDQKPLAGVVVSRTIVTATIPPEYLANAGNYPIELDFGGTRLPAGTFVVKPAE